jgi:hypothetical protein
MTAWNQRFESVFRSSGARNPHVTARAGGAQARAADIMEKSRATGAVDETVVSSVKGFQLGAEGRRKVGAMVPQEALAVVIDQLPHLARAREEELQDRRLGALIKSVRGCLGRKGRFG